MNDENDILEPAAMLDLADATHRRAAAQLAPNEGFLYAVWGLAWLVGFLALWLFTGDDPVVDGYGTLGGVVYAFAIGLGVVVTVHHIRRRTSGVHGRARSVRHRFFGMWVVGLVGIMLVGVGIGRLDAAPDDGTALIPVLAVFTAGLIYMAGGMVWDRTLQYRLGAWVATVGAAAGAIGHPTDLLVLAIGGGGGLVAAAVVARRSPTHAR